MIHSDGRTKALAACLSALAGYVDAIGFLKLGGFFVSFMSGNSTRMAVGLAEGTGQAAEGAGLIAAFVVGVIAGSVTGRIAKRHHRPAVLLLVAFLLAASAGLGLANATLAAMGILAAAMGAENAVFERDGEVRIGLTYMTGTLVKIGQRLTTALMGGDRFGWLPFLLLWLGLIAGAVLGAGIYPYLGLNGLWIASAFAIACAGIAARLEPQT
jgi:uncharacterized membrane protein YoaK (UPF0700 family)